MQRGAALCPFAVFSHFNVIYPLRGRSLCAIQPEAAAYAAYTAEVPQPMRHIQPEFRNLCGIYGRVSAIYIMQQYILQKYTKFRLIHFGSVSNCRYRSIQAQVSFFPHSTIAALYKKAQGCAEGRGLVPLCGFLTFQCDLPSAGFRSPCGIQQGAAIYAVIRPEFRNPCGIYGRSSAIHAGIRPGPPQPMRLLFPHTKFRKYLINKVFPK